MTDLTQALAEVKQAHADCGTLSVNGVAAQIVLDAAASDELIPLADHKLAVVEAYRKGEATFMDEVWSALKADATDLRKQQRILKAFRALADTDALADLDGLAAALKGESHE